MNRLPSKRSICNVTPYLPRYLHWKIKKKMWKCRLLNVLSASSIKGGLKEYGYISFVMGGRNGQAERYLHFSDRGLGGFSWWLDQGKGCPFKSPLNDASILMSYVSFNINYLSHTEIIERGVWSGCSLFAKKQNKTTTTTKKKKKQFSHYSLAIPKSNSRMHLKWVDSLSLSLANMISLLSNYKLLAPTLLEKMLSHRREWNARPDRGFDSWSLQIVRFISKHTCICYGHSLLLLLQDWQLQVSDGRVFSELVNR